MMRASTPPTRLSSRTSKAIAWIQANLTEIRDDLSAYEIELENFQTRLKLAATNVKPMVTSIVTLATNLRCSWIVDYYYQLHGILCGTFLPNVLLLALASFLCAIFGLPMAISDLYINQRMGGHGRGPTGDDASVQPGKAGEAYEI